MKIILTILSTCVFIHSLFAQTTNIPDANFEQALIDLGIDSGTVDGVALTAALSNVTILNVSNKNISDLTGIESFVALTGLVCENNQLISLDLSQNTQLEYLECSNNQITSLDLSNNPLLYNLLCSDNQLTNLDISNINEMWNLSCYNNLLDTLDASNCAIRYLFCGHNALTYFDFKNDSIILEIECSYNQLHIST